MNLIKNLKIDLYRAFSGKLFLIGLLCTQGVFYLNIPWDNIGQSVIYIVNLLLFGSFVQLLLVCGAIPYATAYLSDCENGYIKSLVIRSDLRSYLRSKVIITAISGFLTVFLGKLIFAMTMLSFFPVISPSRTEISQDFVLDVLAVTHPYAYLFVNAATYALGTAAFAVLALLISSLTHNIFVTIMSPMVMYFLFTSITQILHLPADFSIIFLIEGYVFSYADSAVFTFFHVFIFWAVLLVFFGHLFIRHAEKRFLSG